MRRIKDEVAETVDERSGGVGRNLLARDDGVELVELFAEFGLVEGDGDVAKAHHAAGGGELVFVAMLSEAGQFRHHQNRFPMMKGGEDGSHAGVGDDDPCLLKSFLKIRRSEEVGKGNRAGLPTAFTDLREKIGPLPFRCP